MKYSSKIFGFLIIVMFVGTTWFYYDNYIKTAGVVKVSAHESLKSNSSISMMYETSVKSGEYIETDNSEWPTSGYIFNETLSKCENGSSITWDDVNKNIIVNTTVSDRCYIFFDKEEIEFASYIRRLYTTDGVDGMYSHENYYSYDKSLRYAGNDYAISDEYVSMYDQIETEIIKYNCDGERTDGWSYCRNTSYNDVPAYYYLDYDSNKTEYTYLKDAYNQAVIDNYINDNQVKNFVCFASDEVSCSYDNLYRIIGVFGDQVKLIKYDYATIDQLGNDGQFIIAVAPYKESLGFDSTYKGTLLDDIGLYDAGSNIWQESTLNTINLNTNYIAYLNGINTKWSNMIETTKWFVPGIDYYDYLGSSMVTVPALYRVELGGDRLAIGDVFCNKLSTSSGTSQTPEPPAPMGMPVACEESHLWYENKIGLMYLSEYGFANTDDTTLNNWDIKSNWMYMGIDERTMVRVFIEDDFMTPYVAHINVDGRMSSNVITTGSGYAVRPTFYLKSSVLYQDGDGTKENPYRITM